MAAECPDPLNLILAAGISIITCTGYAAYFDLDNDAATNTNGSQPQR